MTFLFNLIALVVLCVFSISPSLEAKEAPVYVGFDGAYGVKNSTSAQAIELGLRAAIFEINASGGVLGGRPIELLTKDNRSVPARGIANLEDFAANPDLVAVFGGRFSPVLLQQVKPTHALKMPLLNVWGAADGITTHNIRPSYTFRLSLKDSWAMPAMLRQAQKQGGNKVGVLLPNNGWGRSNQASLSAALALAPEVELVGSIRYNFGEADMVQHYKTLVDGGADAILLVANDLEGSKLVRQIGQRTDIRRAPIVSHWGVTGGNMVKESGPALADLDFTIVQTFSFLRAPAVPLATFLKSVQQVAGIRSAESIKSPVGAGHAYDMMHILKKAIDVANSTERPAIRNALEATTKHAGLVRNYDHPFSANNHDGLGPEQIFFTRYRSDGVLIPLGQ